MKAKKAGKKLSKVEALLSDVLNGYTTGVAEVREQLEAAAAAVKRTRSMLDSNQAGDNEETASTSRAAISKSNIPRNAAGKRRSLAARKVSASARKRAAGKKAAAKKTAASKTPA